MSDTIANTSSRILHCALCIAMLATAATASGTCLGLVQPAGGFFGHTFIVKDCDFAGNIRTNSTSGTACFTGCSYGKNWFFDGCSFRGNTNWYAGSGCSASVYISNAGYQYTTFFDCSFEGNSVQVINGAAAKTAGTIGLATLHTRLSLVNTLFTGNSFSGAATNAEVFSATSYDQTLAIVNSVLDSADPDYQPLRTARSTGSPRLKPYLYKSSIANFDKDAVGTYDYGRREGISADIDPVVDATLRSRPGSPHRIRGIRVDSPFWRRGADIWIRYRPTTFHHVLLHNDSGNTPWHPINNGNDEADQSDAAMETLGITVDSPLVPDALGNPRKHGKVAYGPIGYAYPAVMKVR